MTETVGSLAAMVGGRLYGDPTRRIVGVGDLRVAGHDRVGFLRDPRLLERAKTTRIGALVVAEPIETPASQIVVDNVDVAFARIAQQFHPTPRAVEHSVHPAATVHSEATLEAPVQIDAHAVVGAGAFVGSGTVIGAGAVIGSGCQVGRDCVIHPRAVLYPGVTLGDRVILHSGAVIGSDGFGYARERDGSWVKWPQVGTVVIESDVEIGANTTVDRAAFGATRIGRGTKLDNLIHVGHNCVLGEHVAMAGLSALSGSVTLGDRVVVAGHTVFGGHLSVAADTRIGGASVLHDSIERSGDYMGFPLMEKARWFRTLRELSRLVPRYREERDHRRNGPAADDPASANASAKP